MSNVSCWMYVNVERHDGAATLECHAFYPRAPVAGDCVLAFEKDSIDADVKSVCLTPDGCWVYLKDDCDDCDDWCYDRDEFWGVLIRQTLQEALSLYFDNGWELQGNLKLIWLESHQWIDADEFTMEYYPLLNLESIEAA